MMKTTPCLALSVNDFGVHFTGSTLGIVGLGNIGLEIAERAHFGFKVGVVYF